MLVLFHVVVDAPCFRVVIYFRFHGRWYLVYGTTGDWGKTWGGIITSIINSVQIQILNTVYKKVAVALTGESNLAAGKQARMTGG